MFRPRSVALFLVVSSALVAACGDDAPNTSGLPLGGLAPDFALADVNPNSASYDSTVTPRDYLEKVSAWYFGHST